MRVEKLTIAHLGPFASGSTIDFHKGMNVLIGQNGSGKSIVLKSIHALITVSRTGIVGKSEMYLGRYCKTNSQLSYRLDCSPNGQTIEGDIKWDSKGNLISAKPNNHAPTQAALQSNLLSLFKSPSFVMIEPNRGEVKQQPVQQVETHSWRGSSTQDRFNRMQHLFYCVNNAEPSWTKSIQDNLNKFFCQNNQKTIAMYTRSRAVQDTNNQAIDVENNGRLHELLLSASGCLEILFIVAETTLIKDSIVVIDEPELHLHPAAQDMLSKYLYYLTTPEGGGNQVIIATHSLHMMYGHPMGHTTLLKQNESGESMALQVIANNEPKEHYDEALRDLGYHKDTFMKAIKFVKQHRKDHPDYTTFTVPDDSSRGTRKENE